MQIWSQDLFQSIFSTGSILAQINIEPDIEGCTIVVNGEESASGVFEAAIGSIVEYEVSKVNYNTVTGSFVVVGPRVLSVSLTQLPMRTVAINTVPAGASVTLTCSNPSYVQQGSVKAIRVPEGTTVHYSVSYPGLNSVEGTTEPIYKDYVDADAIQVKMKAKLEITAEPSSAVVLLNGNKESGSEFDCDEDVYYTVTETGYVPVGTDAQNRAYFNKENGYLYNQNILITLEKQAYKFSLVLDSTGVTEDVLIEIKVNEGPWEVKNSGEYIDVFMDDEVFYRVVYKAQTIEDSSWVMLAENKSIQVRVNPTKHNVNLVSRPENATIHLTDLTTSEVFTGIGALSLEIDEGHEVSYYAEYAGESTEVKTVIITGGLSEVLSVNYIEGVTVITETQDIVLPVGEYQVVLIGGGGAGHTGGSGRSMTGVGGLTRIGGAGGAGGGSGYIIKTTFRSAGGVYNFVIGKGGEDNADGEATSITGENISEVAQGGKCTTDALIRYGGDGGSGGGAAGAGGTSTSSGSTAVKIGGAGAIGGGNGETTDSNGVGGIGFYNTVKNYDSATVGALSGTQAERQGKGGRGVISIQQSLQDAAQLKNISLETLYNAIGGGGGGTGGYPNATDTRSGAPGGGGGGWNPGSTASDYFGSGKGGDGAILYVRISW